MTDPLVISRRSLLAGLPAAGLLTLANGAEAAPKVAATTSPEIKVQRPKVAALLTEFRKLSHAEVILDRILEGFGWESQHYRPQLELVSMYVDQFPDGDLSRERDARFDPLKIYPTIAQALTLGGDKLAVDAVLIIGEHGRYKVNEKGQTLYPRYEFFQQTVDVFRSSGRSVPVFNDKHLSYDNRKAAEMVGWSRELGFGFMAGSSLPVTWRRPELEPPLGTQFTEGLACYGGSVEPYLFHGLETLQCMLERRRGGETGVRTVTCLRGDAVWQAEDAGRFSKKLLQAALSRSPSRNYGNVRDNTTDPVAILIEYRDGTRGTVLNLPEHISDFNFAASITGREEPVSCAFELPAPPGANYFDALTWNIEQLFATGKSPYPVERTLLTSTVLDLAMRSLAEGSRPHNDAALDIHYQAPEESGFFRGRYTQAG